MVATSKQQAEIFLSPRSPKVRKWRGVRIPSAIGVHSGALWSTLEQPTGTRQDSGIESSCHFVGPHTASSFPLSHFSHFHILFFTPFFFCFPHSTTLLSFSLFLSLLFFCISPPAFTLLCASPSCIRRITPVAPLLPSGLLRSPLVKIFSEHKHSTTPG